MTKDRPPQHDTPGTGLQQDEKAQKDRDDERVDEESKESFPASDPPSYSPTEEDLKRRGIRR